MGKDVKNNLRVAFFNYSDLASGANQLSLSERGAVRARQLAYDAVHAALSVRVSPALVGKVPLARRIAAWESRPELPARVDKRITRRAHPPLFGLEMFQKLHDSKLTLNTHIDISSASASNMRLYEATGVGTCLLTDWKENLRDLFELEAEVVSYQSAEDCIEKVRYLLDHEDERRAIAAAGQRRTLRDHTFSQRAEQIHGLIKTMLD
jgi:spore maturation protein CgeB